MPQGIIKIMCRPGQIQNYNKRISCKAVIQSLREWMPRDLTSCGPAGFFYGIAICGSQHQCSGQADASIDGKRHSFRGGNMAVIGVHNKEIKEVS